MNIFSGNSWGVDPDGKACIGCGEQEEFKACADIIIEPFATNKPTYSPPIETEGFDRVFNNDPDKTKWKTTGKTLWKFLDFMFKYSTK